MAVCTVCVHEKVKEINVALLSGQMVKATSVKYGLKRWTLTQHRRKHLPWRNPKAAPAVTVQEKLEELGLDLRRLQLLAECGEDVGKAVAVVRQRQSLLELEARMGHLLGATHKKLLPATAIEGDYAVEFINGRPVTRRVGEG